MALGARDRNIHNGPPFKRPERKNKIIKFHYTYLNEHDS